MDKNEIISYIGSKKLIPIELENSEFSEVKFLNSNSLDELLEITLNGGTKRVYFGYSTYDIRDYEVSYDASRLSNQGNKKLELYNTYVSSLDFSKPYKVTIFIAIDSFFLGVKIDDDWIQREDITDPNMLLEIVKEEDGEEFYLEQIKEHKEHRESKKDEKEKLLDIIQSDPEFPNNKNQETRFWYFLDLIEREEMIEFRDILKPYGNQRYGNIKMFMDEAWRIYKENLKEKLEE